MTDPNEAEINAVRDGMRARFIAEHMNCGATQTQAEQCWDEVMNAPWLGPPMPSIDELDQWAIDNPQTETEAEMDARFEQEQLAHREQLREKYRKLNETGAV
jgi:hypothetical protein